MQVARVARRERRGEQHHLAWNGSGACTRHSVVWSLSQVPDLQFVAFACALDALHRARGPGLGPSFERHSITQGTFLLPKDKTFFRETRLSLERQQSLQKDKSFFRNTTLS